MMLLVGKGPDLWGVFHEKMYVGGSTFGWFCQPFELGMIGMSG